MPYIKVPSHAYLYLAAVIFASSTGPVVIRAAQQAGLPSLYIGSARLVLTAVFIAPIIWRKHRHDFAPLTQRDWLLLFTSGILFALNILMLFYALEYSSVLATTVLRRTSLLWTLWFEITLLGAVFTPMIGVSVALTFFGGLMVALGSGDAIGGGSNPLLGVGIALLGAICMSGYMIIGRSVRTRLNSLTYSWIIFTVAAIFCLITATATGTPLRGYGSIALLWIPIVTIITQGFGHVPINLALQHFPATYLNFIMQVGIVGGAFIAFFAFNEVPSTIQIVGSITILAGLMLTRLSPQQRA